MKWLFIGTCAFYALGILLFKTLVPSPEPCETMFVTQPATTESPPWMAWLVFAGLLFAGIATLARLAWNARHILRGNFLPFATMLVLFPIMLKIAATKPGSTNNTTSTSSSSPTAIVGKQATGSTSSTPSTSSTLSAPTPVATQPAYSLEAAAFATFTTNFFAGRLYPDPQTLLSRDGLHKTLSFAPVPNPQDDDYDTPLGTLLAVYGLPPDIQAVVALVTLDNARSPSRATLLRAPNLALQQAATHWIDPRASPGMLRFQPLGPDRRMLVNNAETRPCHARAGASSPSRPGPAIPST